MNKSILLLAFVTFSSFAMEKESLYLIVGSKRNTTLQNAFPIEMLWQEKKADLSHIHTYDGKATTMDIQNSAIPIARHIVADATSYKFEKNTIKAAYIERMPTSDVFYTDVVLKENTLDSYLGKCIENISKGMKEDGLLEIEWDPYIGFLCNDPHNIKDIYNENLTKKNPFTISTDINLALSSVEMACSPSFSFENNAPQEFIMYATKLSEKIKQLLCFYEKQNVGTQDLLKNRLKEEIWLLKVLITSNIKVLLSSGPASSLKLFSEAIKDFCVIPTQDSSMVGKFLYTLHNGKIYHGNVYDKNTFLSDTFFKFILCDAFIEYNGKYVEEFMKDKNFKNISIERTTSPRNHRTNVWIIRANKS